MVIVVGWQAAFAGGIIKIFNGKKKIVYRCLEPPRFLYDLKKESKSNLSFFSKVFLHILSPLIKSIDYSSVKKCDAVISISKRTKNQVKEIYGIDSEVVEPGIETERFKKYSKEEARKKLKINRGAKIYLSVSKLHKRKRIDLAIEYFKKNRTKGKTVFFIIGDGPEKENLEKIRGGFKDIIFLGRLEDKLVDLYLSAADYFIFTAKNEPFGIAPLEAKLAGCKIVPKDSTNKIQSWEETAKQLNRIYTRVVNENRHYS
ncbi:glycosyltransferase [Candidatus Micrarchaeota archaeon]|nr:glycosyltransferase [Candidatus Micrarchaeota archaeon]